MLVGLACKNAILIVEFARANGGMSRTGRDRSVPLRLRPILMTSFAFILGVVPLISASGTPARKIRQALGNRLLYARRDALRFAANTVFYVSVRWLVTPRVMQRSENPVQTPYPL